MTASDHSCGCRLYPRHDNDEVGDQVAQVKSVGEGAGHNDLEVAQCGVDSLDLGQIPVFECAHYPWHLDASRFGNFAETPHADTADGLGHQAGLSPLGNSIKLEAGVHCELELD